MFSQRDDFTEGPCYDIVYDVVVNEVINLISEDSSDDEEKKSGQNDVAKKRQGKASNWF